jgi:hypothetical protein
MKRWIEIICSNFHYIKYQVVFIFRSQFQVLSSDFGDLRFGLFQSSDLRRFRRRAALLLVHEGRGHELGSHSLPSLQLQMLVNDSG